MALTGLEGALRALERRVQQVSREALQRDDRGLAEDLSMMAGFLDGEARRVREVERAAADRLRHQTALPIGPFHQVPNTRS